MDSIQGAYNAQKRNNQDVALLEANSTGKDSAATRSRTERRGDRTFIVTPNRVILNIGIAAIAIAIPFSILSRSTTLTTDVSAWVIAAAIFALAIGIPHGAVDHLTMSRALPRKQLLGLAAIYLAIAVAAAAAVIAAPGIAFIVVLAMTVWHFGAGDVEASHELDGTAQETGAPRIIHALAVGSAPVLLPLTSPAAISTLTAIQPRLAEYFTPTVIMVTRTAVLALIVVCLLMLIQQGRTRATLELAALTVLGYVVAPLLAFAIYFGLWHALRHTARLAEHTHGTISAKTIWQTFAQGLPALIGTIAVVGMLAAFASSVTVSGAWLWFGLAIVWGLTVPHMIMVSAFDRRQRRASAHS